MDWSELKKGMMFSTRLSGRSRELLALSRVLDGTLYDHIPHPFFKSCGADGSYIPINRRRPSVRTHLCNIVVEDSTSLLFNASHWPLVTARFDDGSDDPVREQKLHSIIFDSDIPSLMEQAAIIGSVGSVAILVQVVDNELVIEIKRTCYLEPTFSLSEPNRLIMVREQYVVDADSLNRSDIGYFEPGNYWFIRDFTEKETIWYQPVPVADGSPREANLIRDQERSTSHSLGVTPIIWIKNLPAIDPTAPDGKSTFSAGIDAMIDADYLLSQTVRGLRYSADPTMVLSGDEYQMSGGISASLPKDPSYAISVPAGGDAKLLEINGTGATASLSMWEALRSLALEAMHGNRAQGDRVSAAQSGRAMELMCLGLTWLTGRLRRSYGDSGLLPLLRLICKITEKIPDVLISGKSYGSISPKNLSLIWPPWFEPTFGDMQTMAHAVQAARTANAVSMDTAVKMMRPATRVPHIHEEREKIMSDLAEHDQRLKNIKAAVEDRDTSEI
ncbi:phage portal protein [Acetobacter nitrogenifigens]|uniref:phage portal protein n=1 Tax=Acetobacter nitrogenifigens TaxID=285268 RepID=UPI0003FEB27D|nr:phage portal protein [Acetobacter nitrogenifigens]